MNELKRKWQRIDESVKRFNKTGEEFYRYTVTPDMTRDVFELITEVERLREELRKEKGLKAWYRHRAIKFEEKLIKETQE